MVIVGGYGGTLPTGGAADLVRFEHRPSTMLMCSLRDNNIRGPSPKAGVGQRLHLTAGTCW